MESTSIKLANQQLNGHGPIDNQAWADLGEKASRSQHFNSHIAKAVLSVLKRDVTIDPSDIDALENQATILLHALEHRQQQQQAREQHADKMDRIIGKSAEQLAEEKARAKQHEVTLKAWRTTNPSGLKDRKSFIEMVDQTWGTFQGTHGEKGRLKLLFIDVTNEWDKLSIKKMRNLIKARAGATIAEVSLRKSWYQRDKEKGQPIRERALCGIPLLMKTFVTGANPQEASDNTQQTQTLNETELKFYRIAAGHHCDLDHVEALADRSIVNPGSFEDRGALIKYLSSASGMPPQRMASFLETSPKVFRGWADHGQSMADTAQAKRMMDIYLPQFLCNDPERLQELSAKCLHAATKVQFSKSIEQLLEEARARKKVGNDEKTGKNQAARRLFYCLFGPTGLTGLSTKRAADAMGITVASLKGLLGHDGFSEDQAEKLVKHIKASKAEKEMIVSIFTKTDSIQTLGQRIKDDADDMTAQKAVAMIRARRKYRAETFAEQLPFSAKTLCLIELGANANPKNAKALCDYYFNTKQISKGARPKANGQPQTKKPDAYYYFISGLCGYPPRTPLDIKNLQEAGAIEPPEAFEHMIAFGGYTRSRFHSEYGMGRETLLKRAMNGKLSDEELSDLSDAINVGIECLTGFSDNQRARGRYEQQTPNLFRIYEAAKHKAALAPAP